MQSVGREKELKVFVRELRSDELDSLRAGGETVWKTGRKFGGNVRWPNLDKGNNKMQFKEGETLI